MTEQTSQESVQAEHSGRRSSRRRGFLLVGVVALLMLGGWRFTAALQPTTGQWVRVERGDLVIGVEVEGELEAVESTTLGPPQVSRMWQFKISMIAPEGANVATGQPVLGFDTTQLQQRLREKMAERDAAEKELEKKTTDLEAEKRRNEMTLAEAQANLRRATLKLTAPEEAVERSEIEKARIDKQLAELEIESSEKRLEYLGYRSKADIAWLREKRDQAAARVEELQESIQEMTVKAPRSGTLIHLADWQGNKFKEGDNVWRALMILEIPDLDRMRGDGMVDEADAGRVAVDQSVTLRLDAYPDRQYRGRVSSIRRAVQRKSPRTLEKVVKVEVEVEETDRERMRPGMRFRGEIEVERVPSTLLLPQEAVRLGADGARVTRKTLWGSQQVEPTFGARNGEFFEVLSGLEEGDRILYQGASAGDGT